MNIRPGGELSARPLNFIWVCDCSGSMQGDKIQQLNFAIREAIPHMRKVADDNPHAQVMVRAIKFSTGAQWHIKEPTPIDVFEWKDLIVKGRTDLGEAFKLLTDCLRMPPMPERALPPVLALISDGRPTDSYKRVLKELLDLPWGKKAVRIAIAIGKDAKHSVLQEFINHVELKPLQANNPEALVRYIRWTSTVVLKSASSPASQTDDDKSSTYHVLITPPEDIEDGPSSALDVW